MSMLRTFLICVIPSVMFVGAGDAQEEAGRTVLDGVYTDVQAKRGEAQYGIHCAQCHEGADVDGPPLSGDPFVDRWREDSLDSLFTFVRTKMPRDRPGKLGEAAYRDILAFLLQLNGYPAGSAELTAPARIQLVGKDGPKPLPTNALVLVVGCFRAGDKDSANLVQASRPARTRTADETSPDELKSSAAKPLADRQFVLQNLEEMRSGFKPETYKDQKVQVKGVLVRQSNHDRINVTSLETVAANCK